LNREMGGNRPGLRYLTALMVADWHRSCDKKRHNTAKDCQSLKKFCGVAVESTGMTGP